MSKLRLISWNVNGIRAVYNKGALIKIFDNNPDIVCLQETKANEDQLSFDIKLIKNYTAYFSSGEKKGYSGVAVYAKDKAINVNNRIGEERFDNEGRSLILEYPKFYLLNIYFPNGQKSQQRVEFKLDYYEAFFKLIKDLERSGKMIIICGDVNTAHTEIDLARPKENSKTSGFLPSERAFLDKLINNGYIDTFRHLNKEPNNYTWWDQKSKARERNVGWRIDYFFIDKPHIKNLINAGIMSDVIGSDHAPVFIDIEL
jgi:exodeoxyribonuclease-3